MIRRAHGKAARLGSTVVVEVSPPDELPAPVPAPARPAANRDETGKLKPGAGTSELARKGGRARHESRQLAALLGLWQPPEGHAFAPYSRLQREWRDSYMATVSETIGGGEADEGAASILSTAALQLGASRWLFDEGARRKNAGMLLQASRLADASRQNVLAAFELAARSAQARPDPDEDDLREQQRAFQRQLAERQNEKGRHEA
jgi:hypothetical protein